MKKFFLVLMACMDGVLCISQLPSFNTTTPISFHNPPYNYTPGARIEDVMEVESDLSFYDGYLSFGVAPLYSPEEVTYYTSIFSIKYDITGTVQWHNVYEEAPDENTEFYNGGAYLAYDFIQTDEGILGLTCEVPALTFGTPMDFKATYFDETGAITNQVPLNPNSGKAYLMHSIRKRNDELLTSGRYMDTLRLANNLPSRTYVNSFNLNSGELLWEHYFSGIESIMDMRLDDDGIWLIGWGYSTTNPESACNNDLFYDNGNPFILRLDLLGEELARYEFNTECISNWVQGAVVANNRLVMFGRRTDEDPNDPGGSFGSFYSSEFVFIDDEIIEVGPHKTYMEGRGFGEVRELLHHEDGSFTQAGWHRAYIPEFDAIRNSGYLMHFNEERDSLWYRNYGYYNNEPINGRNEANHRLTSAKITSDGGFVCVGNIEQGPNDPQPNLETPWIFKVDEFGCLEPGCQLVDNVDEILTNLNGTLELSPNPASSFTKVKATLPSQLAAGKHIEIAVHSAEGRQVFNETLQNEVLKEGKLIRVEDFTSGMYYVSLVVDGRLVDMETLVVE